MDIAIKAKWVEALRSGEYQQTQGKLHDNTSNSYCCLGVLCRVVGAVFSEAEIGTEDDLSTLDCALVLDGRPLVSDDAEDLSATFCKEVGLSNQGDLILLNDGYGKPGEANFKEPQPFSVIADYIEKTL